MNIVDLWRSSDPAAWERQLEQYWTYVQDRNKELERALNQLTLDRLRDLSPQGWYDFLHDEYFRWKYTAPNRYATTTVQLQRYIAGNELDELDKIRQILVSLDPTDIRSGLATALQIRGLGTAGASGLLSLMYPAHFATVDQFVVKALQEIPDLPEGKAVREMNPLNLGISDGMLLIKILSHKATENNRLFETSSWTPRKVDMVLWTFGRGCD